MADIIQSVAPDEGIEAIKGLDSNFRCRDLQYAVGQTYSIDGEPLVCEHGLHACEHPLDVFAHYPPAGSRFAVVRAHGTISRRPGGDTKLAASRLTVEAEIGIPELVSRAVAWVVAQCTSENGEHATGHQGAASSTGNRGAASSTGHQGAASSTGNRGAASSTGYQGAASATGQHGVALAAGIEGRAMAGDGSAIVCCYRNERGELLHIRAGIAGRDGIEAGVWYVLDERGQFSEVRS